MARRRKKLRSPAAKRKRSISFSPRSPTKRLYQERWLSADRAGSGIISDIARSSHMGKLLAVILVLIAVGSAVPILMHTWWMPENISTHGHMIDRQMSETMAESGIAF